MSLYIDEVYVVGGDPISGDNFLSQQAEFPGVKNTGYKWIVQLTNGSGSTIDFANAFAKLTIETEYLNAGNTRTSDERHHEITSGQLIDNASLWIGWDLDINNVTISSASTYLLADQKNVSQVVSSLNAASVIAASRFILYVSTSSTFTNIPTTDIAGNNHLKDPTSTTGGIGGGPIWLVYSIRNNNSDGSGSLRRKASATVPDNTYDQSHWQFGTDDSNLTASAAGDPHICTLFGENYEFDYLGYIRLFDNQHVRSGDDNDLIIINGEVKQGPGRWAHRQYIQKLFIYNAGKTMIVDLGFRGSKVTIEHNDGIDYNECDLDFNDKAQRYCFDCSKKHYFSTTDPNISCEIDSSHNLPPLVRNQIKFNLCGSEEDTKQNKIELSVTLENVNEYNLQPCRLSIDVGNDGIDREAASGCLVHRKYATHCALDKLTNIDDLPEPTEEEIKGMPELEIKPILRNIQWK